MENYPSGHYVPVEQAIHTMRALLRPIRRHYKKLYWAETPEWVAAQLREAADDHGMVGFNQAIRLLLRATDQRRKPNTNRGMAAVHNLFRNVAKRPVPKLNISSREKSLPVEPLRMTVGAMIERLDAYDPKAHLYLDGCTLVVVNPDALETGAWLPSLEGYIATKEPPTASPEVPHRRRKLNADLLIGIIFFFILGMTALADKDATTTNFNSNRMWTLAPWPCETLVARAPPCRPH